MAGKTMVVAVVVAVVAVAVSVLLLLGLGAGGGGVERGGTVPVARLGGWALEVLSGESILGFWGEVLWLRVRCNNTGGGEWYVMPMRNFFLVFANGTEVKVRDTDLWLGFYYVKRGESIQFRVKFEIGGAEPAKLVYREGDRVMEVPLRGVKIEKYKEFFVPVTLVSSDTEPNIIASASFFVEDVGSCGKGSCKRTTELGAHCNCLVPLEERKANLSLKLSLSSLGRVVMKGIECRESHTNTIIEVLSPREPIEFEGRAGVTAVLSIELPPDPKYKVLPIDVIVYFGKRMRQ